VFDKPLIHRCQQHKIRNVRDRLPEKLRTVVEKRMRQAYHASSAVEAEGLLTAQARELHSTNPVASMIEICREHSKKVKRWRDGQMALCWCAAGMLEADHQFRRVNGHLHLPKLCAALDAHFTSNVSAASHNEDQKVA
jgi:hypothetical protein